jgi:hypothetical protein
MTEAEWLTCTDPRPMLARRRASDRKMRLFMVAYCRRVWHLLQDKHRAVIEVAERYADDPALAEEMAAKVEATNDFFYVRWLADRPVRRFLTLAWTVAEEVSGKHFDVSFEELRVQTDLIRDIVGNPFRPPPPTEPFLLTWRDAIIPRAAQAAYNVRQMPEGLLDPDRVAALAALLEEAGCKDAELLGHLRSPGPHVRGCFAIDAILGKR